MSQPGPHDVEKFFEEKKCKHGVSSVEDWTCYNCVVDENEHLQKQFKKFETIHQEDMQAIREQDQEIKKNREDLTRITDKWNIAEEQLAMAMKVVEAARWLAHVNCGVSKDGGQSGEDECRAALEAVRGALDNFADAQDTEELS